MPTTTIRLPDELKARVSAAAEKAGTTSHNFILQAIAEKTEETEQRHAFHQEAEARFAKLLATGKSIPWGDMRAYLEAHIGCKAAPPPVARKLGR